MQRREIRIGDVYEINVRGASFTASVRSKPKGLIGIDPIATWPSWRFCKSAQVRRRVEVQAKLEVAA